MGINTQQIYRVLLENAVSRDTVTARRKYLVDILSRERYLDRADLIARVEMALGNDTFGASAWEDVFYRDMRVVKKSFQAAGYELAYSRSKGKTGYYLRGEGEFAKNIIKQIQNAVTQMDPRQIEIIRNLSPPQRVQQGLSITRLAHQVTDYRRNVREDPRA